MEIAVAILATWRISSLFAKEDGPFHIFVRLRSVRGLGDLLDCLWCVSVWVGALVGLLLHFGLTWVLVPFALSALAIGIDETWQQLKSKSK